MTAGKETLLVKTGMMMMAVMMMMMMMMMMAVMMMTMTMAVMMMMVVVATVATTEKAVAAGHNISWNTVCAAAASDERGDVKGRSGGRGGFKRKEGAVRRYLLLHVHEGKHGPGPPELRYGGGMDRAGARMSSHCLQHRRVRGKRLPGGADDGRGQGMPKQGRRAKAVSGDVAGCGKNHEHSGDMEDAEEVEALHHQGQQGLGEMSFLRGEGVL